MYIINKEDVNLLISTLINTTKDKNPRGKLNDILKLILNSEDVRIPRITLLLWLDTMNILLVDMQKNEFKKIKPIWVPSAIKNEFILIGALTLNEIELLKKNKILFKKNTISYKKYQFELPDTYYTNNIKEIEKFGFEIIDKPLFNNISNCLSINKIAEDLLKGNLILKNIEDVTTIKFEVSENYETVFIENQDEVYLFDWRKRNYDYVKCNLHKELEDPQGVKLIKIIKKKGNADSRHVEEYTLLLQKEMNDEHWKYIYFDTSKIDERWARYFYINKLSHYDLQREINTIDNESFGNFINNIINSKENKIIEINKKNIVNSNHIIKIPEKMIKQLIQYDKQKGILAFPVTMPLPKELMKYLYSCSGNLPTIFKNKYSLNPNYPMKLLFNGSLSENGQQIDYRDETYFMEEEMYLFTSVPNEVAEVVFKKLNLYPHYKTFFETIN